MSWTDRDGSRFDFSSRARLLAGPRAPRLPCPRRCHGVPSKSAPTKKRGKHAPPLIVTSHGGPTSQAFSGFATGVQLFASRGYAVLDVDYGGSTGYGKAYRERLRGTWGITDVDDCVNGARWLAAQGLVDGERRRAIRWAAVTVVAYSVPDAFLFLSTHRIPRLTLAVLLTVMTVSVTTTVVTIVHRIRAARAVAGAMQADEPLLFEAGTGVGKSLAYLIPGIIRAVDQTRPLIVSVTAGPEPRNGMC